MRVDIWYASLPLEDVLSDLFPGPPKIGSSPHNQLICDHPHPIEISLKGMILFADNFGRHIAWRTAHLPRVILLDRPRNAQISEPTVASCLKHNIFGLDIPMYNPLLMQMPQPLKQTRHNKPDRRLIKSHFHFVLAADVMPEVASVHELHQ
jgi:hypothetical protein